MSPGQTSQFTNVSPRNKRAKWWEQIAAQSRVPTAYDLNTTEKDRPDDFTNSTLQFIRTHAARSRWDLPQQKFFTGTEVINKLSDVNARCMSLVGERVWIGEKDGALSVFDFESGHLLHRKRKKDIFVWCIQEIGLHVWVGFSDGMMRVFDRETVEVLKETREHAENGGIYCMLQAVNGRCVFTGSADFIINQWDAVSCERVGILRGHRGAVRCLSTIGQRLYSGSDDNTIKAWDMFTGECVATWEGHSGSVRALVGSGTQLWSASEDNSIRIWDTNIGQCIHVIKEGHTGHINRLLLVGSKIWSCSYSTVFIWDCQTFELQGQFQNHTGYITDMCVVHQSVVSRVWTGAADSEINIWNTESMWSGALQAASDQRLGDLEMQLEQANNRSAEFARRVIALEDEVNKHRAARNKLHKELEESRVEMQKTQTALVRARNDEEALRRTFEEKLRDISSSGTRPSGSLSARYDRDSVVIPSADSTEQRMGRLLQFALKDPHSNLGQQAARDLIQHLSSKAPQAAHTTTSLMSSDLQRENVALRARLDSIAAEKDELIRELNEIRRGVASFDAHKFVKGEDKVIPAALIHDNDRDVLLSLKQKYDASGEAGELSPRSSGVVIQGVGSLPPLTAMNPGDARSVEAMKIKYRNPELQHNFQNRAGLVLVDNDAKVLDHLGLDELSPADRQTLESIAAKHGKYRSSTAGSHGPYALQSPAANQQGSGDVSQKQGSQGNNNTGSAITFAGGNTAGQQSAGDVKSGSQGTSSVAGGNNNTVSATNNVAGGNTAGQHGASNATGANTTGGVSNVAGNNNNTNNVAGGHTAVQQGASNVTGGTNNTTGSGTNTATGTGYTAGSRTEQSEGRTSQKGLSTKDSGKELASLRGFPTAPSIPSAPSPPNTPFTGLLLPPLVMLSDDEREKITSILQKYRPSNSAPISPTSPSEPLSSGARHQSMTLRREIDSKLQDLSKENSNLKKELLVAQNEMERLSISSNDTGRITEAMKQIQIMCKVVNDKMAKENPPEVAARVASETESKVANFKTKGGALDPFAERVLRDAAETVANLIMVPPSATPERENSVRRSGTMSVVSRVASKEMEDVFNAIQDANRRLRRQQASTVGLTDPKEEADRKLKDWRDLMNVAYGAGSVGPSDGNTYREVTEFLLRTNADDGKSADETRREIQALSARERIARDQVEALNRKVRDYEDTLRNLVGKDDRALVQELTRQIGDLKSDNEKVKKDYDKVKEFAAISTAKETDLPAMLVASRKKEEELRDNNIQAQEIHQRQIARLEGKLQALQEAYDRVLGNVPGAPGAQNSFVSNQQTTGTSAGQNVGTSGAGSQRQLLSPAPGRQAGGEGGDRTAGSISPRSDVSSVNPTSLGGGDDHHSEYGLGGGKRSQSGKTTPSTVGAPGTEGGRTSTAPERVDSFAGYEKLAEAQLALATVKKERDNLASQIKTLTAGDTTANNLLKRVDVLQAHNDALLSDLQAAKREIKTLEQELEDADRIKTTGAPTGGEASPAATTGRLEAALSMNRKLQSQLRTLEAENDKLNQRLDATETDLAVAQSVRRSQSKSGGPQVPTLSQKGMALAQNSNSTDSLEGTYGKVVESPRDEEGLTSSKRTSSTNKPSAGGSQRKVGITEESSEGQGVTQGQKGGVSRGASSSAKQGGKQQQDSVQENYDDWERDKLVALVHLLEQQFDDLKRNNDKSESEFAALRKQVKQEQMSVESARATLNAEAKKLEALKTSHDGAEALNKMTSSLAAKESEVADRNEQITLLEAKVAHTENALRVQTERLNKCEEYLQSLSMSPTSALAQKDDVRERATNLLEEQRQEHINILERNLDTARQEVAGLQSLLKQNRASQAKLSGTGMVGPVDDQRIAELRSEITRLQNDAIQTKRVTEQAIATAKNEVTAASAREFNLQDKIATLNVQVEANQKGDTESLNVLVSKLTNELTDTREQLQEAERQLATHDDHAATSPRAAMKRTPNSLNKILRSTSDPTVADMQLAATDISQQLALAQQEIKRMRDEYDFTLKALTGEAMTNREAMSSLRKELQQRQASIHMAKEREEALLASITNKSQAQVLRQMQTQIHTLDEKNASLDNQVTALQNSLEGSKRQTNELNVTVAELKDKLNHAGQDAIARNVKEDLKSVGEITPENAVLVTMDDLSRDVTAMRLHNHQQRQQALLAENESLRARLDSIDLASGKPSSESALEVKITALQREVQALEGVLRQTEQKSRGTIEELQRHLEESRAREQDTAQRLTFSNIAVESKGTAATSVRDMLQKMSDDLASTRQKLVEAERRAAAQEGSAASTDPSSGDLPITQLPPPRTRTAARLSSFRKAEATHDEMRAAVVDLSENLDSADKDLRKASMHFERALQMSKAEAATAQDTVEVLQRELSRKAAELEAAIGREASYINNTNADDALKKLTLTTQQQLHAANAKNADLTDKIDNFASDIASLGRQLSEARDQIAKLQEERKKITDELDSSRQRGDLAGLKLLPGVSTTRLVGAMDELDRDVSNLQLAASRRREDTLAVENESLRNTIHVMKVAASVQGGSAGTTSGGSGYAPLPPATTDQIISKLQDDNARLSAELASRNTLKEELDKLKKQLIADYERKASALEQHKTNEVQALNALVQQLETDLAQQRGNDQAKKLASKIAMMERQLQEQAAFHESQRAVRRGSDAGAVGGGAGGNVDPVIGFYMEREKQWSEMHNLNRQLQNTNSVNLAESQALAKKLKALAYFFETRPTLLKSLYELYKLVAAIPKTLSAFSRVVNQRQLSRLECLAHINEILMSIESVKEGNRWIIANLFTAYELQHLGASPSLFPPDGPRPTWRDVTLPDRYNRLWAYSNVTTDGDGIPAPPGASTTSAFALNPRMSVHTVSTYNVSPQRGQSSARQRPTN